MSVLIPIWTSEKTGKARRAILRLPRTKNYDANKYDKEGVVADLDRQRNRFCAGQYQPQFRSAPHAATEYPTAKSTICADQ